MVPENRYTTAITHLPGIPLSTQRKQRYFLSNNFTNEQLTVQFVLIEQLISSFSLLETACWLMVAAMLIDTGFCVCEND